MVKILHAGDFHLDASLASLKNPRLAAVRREELRATFLRVIEEAVSSGAKLVLLSGDVFDGEKALRSTVSLVKEALGKASSIHFFIAPGNHDPLVQNSQYLSQDWPQNVHIFGVEMEKVELPELGLCVWGAGFVKGERWEKVLSGFKVEQPEKINIMVLHGELSAPGGPTPYGPVTVKEIADSKLDYLALGHVHTASALQKAGDTYYAYSGCPEGQGFDETGEKGVLVGTVEKGDVRLSFLPVSKRRYEIVDVNVEDAATSAQVAAKIREVAGALLPHHLVRIVLRGERSAQSDISLSLVQKELEEAFYLEIKDETTLSKDFEGLAGEQTLQGIFVARLLQKIGEAQDDVLARKTAEAALRYGMAAMSDEEVQVW